MFELAMWSRVRWLDGTVTIYHGTGRCGWCSTR